MAQLVPTLTLVERLLWRFVATRLIPQAPAIWNLTTPQTGPEAMSIKCYEEENQGVVTQKACFRIG